MTTHLQVPGKTEPFKLVHCGFISSFLQKLADSLGEGRSTFLMAVGMGGCREEGILPGESLSHPRGSLNQMSCG